VKKQLIDCEELIETLLQKLQQIESSESDVFSRTNSCLTLCVEYLDKLRTWLVGYKFPDTAAEIHFFKKTKPVILSRIIYYRKVMDLHLDICPGCGHIAEQQLTAVLHATTQFFERNRAFYNYYRKEESQYDEALFVRGRSGVNLFRNNHYDIDPVFSTGYDGKLAKFMAHELFADYVNKLLHPPVCLENNSVRTIPLSTLICTATTTSIVELGYALYAGGFFNHGNASIKDIMSFLSDALQVNLHKYYDTFVQIRERKTNPTKYIDELKNNLAKYIDKTGN
jgi:hypothetical protein